MDRSGFEFAKFMCSPSPRDAATSEALWGDVRRGTLDVVSSDHSGSSYEGEGGKRIHGNNAPFPDIPNGVPGLTTRLPLVFIVYRTDDNLALQRLVAAGLGHACIGRVAASRAVDPALTWLEPDEATAQRTIALCYARHRPLTATARTLITAIRSQGG